MALFLVVVLVAYFGVTLFAPLHQQIYAVAPAIAPYYDTGKASMTWPNYGQAAVGTQQGGLLAKHGPTTKSVPIASVAKIMTALSVLHEKPLKPGEQGPTLTLTQDDQQIYDEYYRKDGSIAPVAVGEKITEYQALQALLLPSANNFADTLVIWTFGSILDYTEFANDYAKELGLQNSHFADASGFSPDTVSTATDLVKLGQHAMDNPVIAEIVGQSTAVIPVAGTIHNVNGMLRLGEGVVGIKTGNTDQAGGCMLLAVTHKVGKTSVVIISAVLGAPHLTIAMKDALQVAKNAKKNLISMKILSTGQTFGAYSTTWGESAEAATAKSYSAVVWKGSNVQVSPQTEALRTPADKGQVVGSVIVTGIALADQAKIPLELTDNLDAPNVMWRLTHPLEIARSI